jgi:hypothetical protein
MAVEGVAGRVVPDRRDPMASGSVASDPEPPMAVPDHGGLVWATTHEGCVLRDTAGWTGEVAVTSGSPEIDQWRRGLSGHVSRVPTVPTLGSVRPDQGRVADEHDRPCPWTRIGGRDAVRRPGTRCRDRRAGVQGELSADAYSP